MGYTMSFLSDIRETNLKSINCLGTVVESLINTM